MRRLSTHFVCVAAGMVGISAAAAEPLFGRHFPNGDAAVSYLYGPHGMWRDQAGVSYLWNYYPHCASPERPTEAGTLRALGATVHLTSPDVNCLILGDYDNDGEIEDDLPAGHAFHEHSGRSVNGEERTRPFYHFWFDDNWLARYVAEAYDKPHPMGLHDDGYTLRWRVLGGDNNGAVFYGETNHVDQLALNGLHALNADDYVSARAAWEQILQASDALFDNTRLRYEYPGIEETYHLALWLILTERLLERSQSYHDRQELLQHAVALRTVLLRLQERDAEGQPLGWITGIGQPSTLMNTETIAMSVLGLGAGVTWAFEAGQAPLSSGAGAYFDRDEFLLAARRDRSRPGHVVFGPYWEVEPGTYDVDFTLRAHGSSEGNDVATLDVYDGTAIVAIETMTHSHMPAESEWYRHRLTAHIRSAEAPVEFRVYWHGHVDLDVGPIRVKRRAVSNGVADASQLAAPIQPRNLVQLPATEGVGDEQRILGEHMPEWQQASWSDETETFRR